MALKRVRVFALLLVAATLLGLTSVTTFAPPPKEGENMHRYTQLPITLYRIQPRLPVKLRDYETQMAKGRTSFDLKLHDGLIKPMPEVGPFHTPNGMSLRPGTQKMEEVLRDFRGEPTIYRMHEGMTLPEGLVVFHEHTDHYSMQTTQEISLEDYNMKLTNFLESLPSQSRQEYFDWLDDLDDQDN
eukprot:TRINITY_DN7081_c0_g1_i1.p1 TRINITY_DN7081_c0_g1~~TRINITY_DN7081_c0_g1_i1.p1  ORF type:complete len:186 (+),score=29.33 TRINITY_DN7081_c0_g1_i1:164-721(+)